MLELQAAEVLELPGNFITRVPDEKIWEWGFGKGEDGKLLAMESFSSLIETQNPRVASRVVMDGVEPLALIAFRFLSPERRGVHLVPYIFDMERGVEVLEAATAMLVSLHRGSVHRIQAEIVTRAKAERAMFKQVGYRQEGRRRESLWCGTNAMDTVLLAITRPEFLKQRRS